MDNPIKLGLQDALSVTAFRRKGNMWFRDMPETFLVIDVQKSTFGQQYYVNLGVFVKGLPEVVPYDVPTR